MKDGNNFLYMLPVFMTSSMLETDYPKQPKTNCPLRMKHLNKMFPPNNKNKYFIFEFY